MPTINFRRLLALMLVLAAAAPGALSRAEGLTPERLGVIFDAGNPQSVALARLYAVKRGVPAENLVGIDLPRGRTLEPQQFEPLRDKALSRLPTQVQSLLLVWSDTYAVGCMSVTSAFAIGYQGKFCEPGCGTTALNPLFDTPGWLPADTVGWFPAMLLPADAGLAPKLIERGIEADGSNPPGRVYLVSTADWARNVRAAKYPEVQIALSHRIEVVAVAAPVSGNLNDIMGYFTGVKVVDEIDHLHFRPGAIADHLTSFGGLLGGGSQMSVLSWLSQGATGSYGTVTEPCNHPEKFPDPRVLFEHYLNGETLLESYWKSVRMPGQGLFVGEPLARPFGKKRS